MEGFQVISRHMIETLRAQKRERIAKEIERGICRGVETIYTPAVQKIKLNPDADTWTVESQAYPHELTDFTRHGSWTTILERLQNLFPDFEITKEVYSFTFKLREPPLEDEKLVQSE